jgi:hypothetical protein
MKKIIFCIALVMAAVSCNECFASYSADLGNSSTVVLVSNGPLMPANDIGITSYTEKIYEDDVLLARRDVSNIIYQRKVSNWGVPGLPEYRVTGFDQKTQYWGYGEEIKSSIFGVNQVLNNFCSGLGLNFARVGNLLLGVLVKDAYMYNSTEAMIAIHFSDYSYMDPLIPPAPHKFRSEISNLIISDLTTKETVAVVAKLESPCCNRVILNKLEQIRQDVKQNKTILAKIWDYLFKGRK